MVKLFGRDWTKDELRRHVGSLDQLGGITAGERTDGPARGVRTLDVQTGGGLSFTVLPDRALDIGEARLDGVPLAWISAMGVVHPAFHERDGRGWERTFGGGLLATCGLDNAGGRNDDEGETYPLHGRINHLPAMQVQHGGTWDGDAYTLAITGQVRQANLNGEKLLLTRRIETQLGSTTLAITDTVTNEGFRPEPVILLHHLNFGFPLVSPESEVILPAGTSTTPGDDAWQRGGEPGVKSQVYVHTLPKRNDGMARLALVNRPFGGGQGLGVAIDFSRDSFPLLWHWRHLQPGDYVMGLEPSNAEPGGRHATREAGTLRTLAPGESATFRTVITALGNSAAIDAAVARVAE